MSNAPPAADVARDPKLLTRRFVDFARYVFDEREASGTIRGITSERNRFALHLEHAAFAEKPLDQITRGDIEAWLQDMAGKLARCRRALRSGILTNS